MTEEWSCGVGQRAQWFVLGDCGQDSAQDWTLTKDKKKSSVFVRNRD